jgi:PilZ domain
MRRDLALAEDRRGSQRFRIRTPLTVIAEDREIPAYTRDLSNRGVYFYLALADSALIDNNFQFLVEMPSEITLSTDCRIRCRAKLVRKEMNSRSSTDMGLAAEILDYSILGDALSPA